MVWQLVKELAEENVLLKKNQEFDTNLFKSFTAQIDQLKVEAELEESRVIIRDTIIDDLKKDNDKLAAMRVELRKENFALRDAYKNRGSASYNSMTIDEYLEWYENCRGDK